MFIYLFIHKYVSYAYFMPGTVLSRENAVMNKKITASNLFNERQTIN